MRVAERCARNHDGWHEAGMRQVRLRFAFPEVAAVRYREQFARVLEGTGWTVHLNKLPHQERLAEAACALVPDGYTLRKPPALHLEHKTVALTLDPPLPTALASTLAAALQERTGFTLVCAGTEPSQAGTGPVILPAEDTPRLEMNADFQAIDTAFAAVPPTARPYRKSLKAGPTGALIELAFLTPEVAQPHAALLHQLSARTGYALTIKDEANQSGLVAYLQAVIPEAWQMQSTPSILRAKQLVRVTCASPPRPGSGASLLIADRVRQETGWTLAVETRRRLP